ncbi:hypothetical protein GF402_10425 [Candidatus Fermentibacteria bacterium]|nr:hypothetical protein [Candidatus Fermentibacteria bacterium]
MFCGLVLCALLLSGGQPSTYYCPPVSDGYDLVTVLLREGRLPHVPWDGLDEGHRELLWTYACRGMLVQRTSWSGYLIVCPAGTAESLAPLAEALVDPALEPDSGVWPELLQLEGNDCDPAILLFTPGDGERPVPPALPLRSSEWLSGESDTLIHEGAWSNDVFLWIRSPQDFDLTNTEWRGLSSQLALADGELVPVNLTTCVSGTPASLADIDRGDHRYDSVFSSPWGQCLKALDSLMAEIHPLNSDRHHLLWLRGRGDGEPMIPWKAWPMPSPSPGSPLTIEGPSEYGPPSPRVPPPPETSTVRVILVDTLAGSGELAVAATLLERMLAWLLLPDADWLEEVSVMPSGSQAIEITFLGCAAGIGADSALIMARKALEPMILAKPPPDLLHNAGVRASFLEGRRISQPDPLRMVRILSRLTGFGGSG